MLSFNVLQSLWTFAPQCLNETSSEAITSDKVTMQTQMEIFAGQTIEFDFDQQFAVQIYANYSQQPTINASAALIEDLSQYLVLNNALLEDGLVNSHILFAQVGNLNDSSAMYTIRFK